MAYIEFIWDDSEGGNVWYIAEHGVTMDEFEQAFFDFAEETTSDSSGRPMRFGYTDTNRCLCVIWEVIDDVQVYPFNAYEVGSR